MVCWIFLLKNTSLWRLVSSIQTHLPDGITINRSLEIGTRLLPWIDLATITLLLLVVLGILLWLPFRLSGYLIIIMALPSFTWTFIIFNLGIIFIRNVPGSAHIITIEPYPSAHPALAANLRMILPIGSIPPEKLVHFFILPVLFLGHHEWRSSEVEATLFFLFVS